MHTSLGRAAHPHALTSECVHNFAHSSPLSDNQPSHSIAFNTSTKENPPGADEALAVVPIIGQSGLVQPGASEAIIASLTNLELIDESALTWAQVLEIREDEEAKTNLRRLQNWIDAEMIGKEQSYIQNEVAIRYQDYRDSLKKHGGATIMGAMDGIFDWKMWALAAGSIAGGHPEFMLPIGGIAESFKLRHQLGLASITLGSPTTI